MPTRLTEMTDEALALPVGDRLTVAMKLWESIAEEDRAVAVPVEPEVLAEVRRRDDELSAGTVTGRSHDEVMSAARNAIR
jgi:putative addiction module component (TIGR02574 family)